VSALPNPLHTEKKAPARAARPLKLNQYGRDPQSLGERARESSDYDTEKGYAPFFHAFLADWPRLSSGETSCLLFQVVLCKSLGRSVRKGEPRAVKTLPLAVSDLAALCWRDERSIQRELAGWEARRVAKVTSEGKGLVSIELLYRGWEALPNYRNVVDIATGEPVPDESADGDEKAKEHTRIELTKSPVACKAGGRSKGVKIDCGVQVFHLVNPSVVDFEITAMVQAGDLVITTKVADEWLQNAAKRAAVSSVSKDLDSPPRHGCPSVPANAGSAIPAKKIVNHPRAAELVKLFDPILAMSAARLLSGDFDSLTAACVALADCDHDFLVHFVVQRAERPVKSPLHVKTICAEALASWKASKVLDGAGLPKHEVVASPAEIQALIAKDRAERLARGKKR
jgi:hypothetical protein